MITANFNFKGRKISLSWADQQTLKKIVGIQTSYFGKDPETLTDELLINCIEFEYHHILNCLEDGLNLPNNPSILDIGSGTSIIDLVLSIYYKDTARFYLLDGERLKEIRCDNIFDKGYGPFNQWDPVHDAIATNGLDNKKFTFLTSNLDQDLKKYNSQWEDVQVDMVISISSWGLHYPIETYWDKVMKVLKPGGYLFIAPVVNIDNQYEFICSQFGSPMKSDEFTMELIKNVRPNDLLRWQKLMPNTNDLDAIWGWRAIWQRPF